MANANVIAGSQRLKHAIRALQEHWKAVEPTWDSDIAGHDNRLVTTVATSYLDFVRPGAANFPDDSVSLVDPSRGVWECLLPAAVRFHDRFLTFQVAVSSELVIYACVSEGRRQPFPVAGVERFDVCTGYISRGHS